MKISVLTVTFHLDGCRSLKEKRRRMGGMRDKFGRQSNLAICESWYQNDHQQAEWTFVATGRNQAIVSATLDKLMEKLEGQVDAQIIDTQLEHL